MMPTVILIGGFFVGIAFLAFRAYKGKPTSGMEGLIGETGVVEDIINPVGLIFAHGEYWKASSSEVIEQGEKVRIIGSKGLELIVKKVELEDSQQ